nr:hypothetical protein CFP56_18098 [Quercus suber]
MLIGVLVKRVYGLRTWGLWVLCISKNWFVGRRFSKPVVDVDDDFELNFQGFKDDDEFDIDEEDEVLGNRLPPLLWSPFLTTTMALQIPAPRQQPPPQQLQMPSNAVIASAAILGGSRDGGIAHLSLHAVPSGEDNHSNN